MSTVSTEWQKCDCCDAKIMKSTAELISMEEIERIYEPGKQSHWFDADTKRFFKCRLPEYGYRGPGGIYFVSSEKPPHGARSYTVRRLADPGKIETVSEFCAYGTRGPANTAARKLAESEVAK